MLIFFIISEDADAGAFDMRTKVNSQSWIMD
jgi:hypothetical protein